MPDDVANKIKLNRRWYVVDADGVISSAMHDTKEAAEGVAACWEVEHPHRVPFSVVQEERLAHHA